MFFFSSRQFHLIEITLTFIYHLHLWVFFHSFIQCTQYVVECCTVSFVSSSNLADFVVVFFFSFFIWHVYSKSFVLFGCFMFIESVAFDFKDFSTCIFHSLPDYFLANLYLRFWSAFHLQFVFSFFISQFNKVINCLYFQTADSVSADSLSSHRKLNEARTMKQ